MKKYLHVINIGIQNNLTYRFNFLARTLFGLIPLIAILCMWRKIYEGKGGGAMGPESEPKLAAWRSAYRANFAR